MGRVGFRERPSASQRACDGLFWGGDGLTGSKITATFEVVTPLFLGGADPASTVELRPPSIKGALRFWWRALAWSRHRGDLDAIKKEEQKIFGTAGDDRDRLGQASFGLRARWRAEPNRLAETGPRSLTSGKPGASYLSYGIINRGQGNSPRSCYQLGGCFELTFQALRHTDNESGFHPSLLDAIKLFGLLGGLGGRSRRGWGSGSDPIGRRRRCASVAGSAKLGRIPGCIVLDPRQHCRYARGGL